MLNEADILPSNTRDSTPRRQRRLLHNLGVDSVSLVAGRSAKAFPLAANPALN